MRFADDRLTMNFRGQLTRIKCSDSCSSRLAPRIRLKRPFRWAVAGMAHRAQSHRCRVRLKLANNANDQYTYGDHQCYALRALIHC